MKWEPTFCWMKIAGLESESCFSRCGIAWLGTEPIFCRIKIAGLENSFIPISDENGM